MRGGMETSTCLSLEHRSNIELTTSRCGDGDRNNNNNTRQYTAVNQNPSSARLVYLIQVFRHIGRAELASCPWSCLLSCRHPTPCSSVSQVLPSLLNQGISTSDRRHATDEYSTKMDCYSRLRLDENEQQQQHHRPASKRASTCSFPRIPPNHPNT
jgi:hypothetical protein